MESLTTLLSKSGRTELENEAIHKILWSNELLARMFEKFGTHSEKDRIELCGYFNICTVKPGQLVIKQNTKNGLKVFVGLAGNSMVYKDEVKIFSALEESEKRMFTEIWENVLNLAKWIDWNSIIRKAKTNDSQLRSSNPQTNSALPSQRPPETPAYPKNPYARSPDDKTLNSLLKLPGAPLTINNLEDIPIDGATAVDFLKTPMMGPNNRLVRQTPEKSEDLKPVARLSLGVGFHQ